MPDGAHDGQLPGISARMENTIHAKSPARFSTLEIATHRRRRPHASTPNSRLPGIGEVEIFERHDRHQKISAPGFAPPTTPARNTNTAPISRMNPPAIPARWPRCFSIVTAAPISSTECQSAIPKNNAEEIASTICHKKKRLPAWCHLCHPLPIEHSFRSTRIE